MQEEFEDNKGVIIIR